jgi:hypothetical protein
VELDEQYAYVPIIRLTETDIHVGDRKVSLTRTYLQGDTAEADSNELSPLFGSPIEDIESAWEEDTRTQEIDIAFPGELAKGKVTIHGRAELDALDGSIKVDLSRDPRFLRMVYRNRNKSVTLSELRLTVVTVLTSSSALPSNMYVYAKVGVKAQAVTYWMLLAADDITEIVVPTPALTEEGSSTVLTKSNVVASPTTTIPGAIELEESIFEVKVARSDAQALTGGSLFVELDFLV